MFTRGRTIAEAPFRVWPAVLLPTLFACRLEKTLFTTFQTIIFRQVDETDAERGVWVRMSPSHWGVSIALFKEQPTEETPEWQAMTSIHVDPCFDNRSKVTAWNEHNDPENSHGREFILVESIDGWKPRPQEESDAESEQNAKEEKP